MMSATKHDQNTPTRGTNAWMWKAISDQDHVKAVAPLVGIDPSTILPASDPLVQRTQLWLDRIYKSIRDAHPDQTANVPAPRATVIKSDTVNAFVAPVPVCYSASVELAGGGNKTVDQIVLDLEDGSLDATQVACVPADDESVLQDMVDTFNKAGLDCQYSLSGTTLVPNDKCTVADSAQNVGKAKSVAILETANHVHVYSAIVPIMTEKEFVAVLAHELGHYFRSHMTAPSNEYNYFYTLTENEPDHKPTPDPSLADLGQKAIASAGQLDSSDLWTQVPGQKLRSDLFMGVGALIEQVGKASHATSACKTAKTYIDGHAFQTAIAQFPVDTATDAQTAAYNQFESKALDCLASISLASDDGVLTGNSVSWDQVLQIVATPSWPDWTTSPDIADQITALFQQIASAISQRPDASDLKAAFLAATDDLNNADTNALNVLKQAYTTHLGEYTYEQEADDESIEWTSGMGFDPQTLADSMDALGQGMPDSLDGLSLGQQSCETLWHKNFLNDDGSYAFVPIGDFTDIHHSVCYRIFNAEREIKAHHDVAAPVTPPATDGSDWTDLQNHAKSFSQQPSSFGGGAFVRPALSPLLKNNPAMSCIFAPNLR